MTGGSDNFKNLEMADALDNKFFFDKATSLGDPVEPEVLKSIFNFE